LLAPDLVEAILDGRQPAEMTLAVLMQPFAVGWREQEIEFGFRRTWTLAVLMRPFAVGWRWQLVLCNETS